MVGAVVGRLRGALRGSADAWTPARGRQRPSHVITGPPAAAAPRAQRLPLCPRAAPRCAALLRALAAGRAQIHQKPPLLSRSAAAGDCLGARRRCQGVSAGGLPVDEHVGERAAQLAAKGQSVAPRGRALVGVCRARPTAAGVAAHGVPLRLGLLRAPGLRPRRGAAAAGPAAAGRAAAARARAPAADARRAYARWAQPHAAGRAAELRAVAAGGAVAAAAERAAARGADRGAVHRGVVRAGAGQRQQGAWGQGDTGYGRGRREVWLRSQAFRAKGNSLRLGPSWRLCRAAGAFCCTPPPPPPPRSNASAVCCAHSHTPAKPPHPAHPSRNPPELGSSHVNVMLSSLSSGRWNALRMACVNCR
jgi:hypothetical protein